MLINHLDAESRYTAHTDLVHFARLNGGAQLLIIPEAIAAPYRSIPTDLNKIASELLDDHLSITTIPVVYNAIEAFEQFALFMAGDKERYGHIAVEGHSEIQLMLQGRMALGGMPNDHFFEQMAQVSGQDVSALRAYCEQNAAVYYSKVGAHLAALQGEITLPGLDLALPCSIHSIGISRERREIQLTFDPKADIHDRFDSIIDACAEQGIRYVASADGNSGKFVVPMEIDVDIAARNITRLLQRNMLIDQINMNATRDYFGVPHEVETPHQG